MSWETNAVLCCDACGSEIEEGRYKDHRMVERLIRSGGRGLRRRQQRRPERERELVDVELGDTSAGIYTRMSKATVHLCVPCSASGVTIDGQVVPPAASPKTEEGRTDAG